VKKQAGGSVCAHGEPNAAFTGGVKSSEELKHACNMLESLEHARSQNVSVQSGMVATLIPLAGLVGYKASRTGGSANTAALATGGLSIYAVGATLAQPDRLKIYDSGIDSVSCAIGVYTTTLNGGGAPPPSPASFVLQRRAADLSQRISSLAYDARDRQAPQLQFELQNAQAIVDILSIPVMDSGVLLRAQLRQSVEKTINQVNSLLSNTVPDSSDALAGSLGALSNSAAAKKKQAKVVQDEADRAANSIASLDSGGSVYRNLPDFATRLSSINVELRALARLYVLQADLADDGQKLLSADFRDCRMDSPTASAQLPLTPMSLGPGDSFNNQDITIARGGSSTVGVFGGVPPYYASFVDGPFPRPSISFPSENGVTSMLLAINEKDVADLKEELRYQVLITDATGRPSKRLTIIVPTSERKSTET